jgi:hypothetical protein
MLILQNIKPINAHSIHHALHTTLIMYPTYLEQYVKQIMNKNYICVANVYV